MKKRKTKIHFTKTVLVLSAFSLLFSFFGGACMNNTQTTQTATTEPAVQTLLIVQGTSKNADSEYYRSAFQSVAEVKASGEKYVETVAAEGFTLNALPQSRHQRCLSITHAPPAWSVCPNI